MKHSIETLIKKINPEKAYALTDRNSVIKKVIELSHTLPDYYRDSKVKYGMVLRFRYLAGYTQEKTAKELGISRQRVSQIEHKAVRMIRHPARFKHLRPFLEEI